MSVPSALFKSMSTRKAVNPRKIPRTQADVDRAYERGRKDGIYGSLVIMLYTLKDKFGTTDEELSEFSRAFNYTLDGIEKGYIKDSDLRTVVKKEYGLSLEVV